MATGAARIVSDWDGDQLRLWLTFPQKGFQNAIKHFADFS
jgi:hypothetical protein